MKSNNLDRNYLITSAAKASKYAYAPYSKVRIGAAVLAGEKVYTGANVENGSFGNTICAERAAIIKAVNEGEFEFKMLAVYSSDVVPVPCGECLQTMAEFFTGEERIIIASKDEIKEFKFSELLPQRFILKE